MRISESPGGLLKFLPQCSESFSVSQVTLMLRTKLSRCSKVRKMDNGANPFNEWFSALTWSISYVSDGACRRFQATSFHLNHRITCGVCTVHKSVYKRIIRGDRLGNEDCRENNPVREGVGSGINEP